MTGYHLPGLYIEERRVSVPLDWANPEGERIEVFVREIVDADADYALALKGNQESVHDEVKGYLDDAVARWAKALRDVPAKSRCPLATAGDFPFTDRAIRAFLAAWPGRRKP